MTYTHLLRVRPPVRQPRPFGLASGGNIIMLNISFLYLGNLIRRTVNLIYSRHLNTSFKSRVHSVVRQHRPLGLASGGNIILMLNISFLYLGNLNYRADNSIYSRYLSTSLESSLTCRTTPPLGVSQWWQYICTK